MPIDDNLDQQPDINFGDGLDLPDSESFNKEVFGNSQYSLANWRSRKLPDSQMKAVATAEDLEAQFNLPDIEEPEIRKNELPALLKGYESFIKQNGEPLWETYIQLFPDIDDLDLYFVGMRFDGFASALYISLHKHIPSIDQLANQHTDSMWSTGFEFVEYREQEVKKLYNLQEYMVAKTTVTGKPVEIKDINEFEIESFMIIREIQRKGELYGSVPFSKGGNFIIALSLANKYMDIQKTNQNK